MKVVGLITLTRLVILSVLLAVGVLAPYTAGAQEKLDNQKFLADMRNAYSLLRRQGLTEINASVLPNWESIFATLSAERRPEAMRLARQIRFSLFVDANGTVMVTHRFVGSRLSKKRAEAAIAIALGVDRSVSGFLLSWAPFMMTQLIPEKLDQFVLQDLKNEYLLSFNDLGVDIGLKINSDLVITELGTSQGTIKPSLMRTDSGFVLTGYEGTNEDPVLGRVVMKAKIVSAPVTGMLLPQSVSLGGSASGSAFNLKFSFANYRLKTNTPVTTK